MPFSNSSPPPTAKPAPSEGSFAKATQPDISHNIAAHHAGHFGFERTSAAARTKKVEDVFSRVATRYDLMNDVLSGGWHRVWKADFLTRMAPRPYEVLADIAGGSGDIARGFLRRAQTGARVFLCDLTHNMLRQSVQHAVDQQLFRHIHHIRCNAQELALADDAVDCYSIAFGLRNVTDIPAALSEALRVLRPGGRFFCLEFSRIQSPVFDRLYQIYAKNLVPKLGEIIAKDRDSYQYLIESIAQFPTQEQLADLLKTAGFTQLRWTNLTRGIAAIHQAVKPL